MSQQTFRQWLTGYRGDDPRILDLRRDALADPQFPWCSQVRRRLYLDGYGERGTESLHAAWEAYRKRITK